MSEERGRSRLALWEEVEMMKVKGHYSMRTMKDKNGIPQQNKGGIEMLSMSRRHKSEGHRGKIIWRYFTLESVVLLGCLTVSLLILPLVLPPLPPPPFLLLLLPIFILALLMLLAFMPSNARHATYTYL